MPDLLALGKTALAAAWALSNTGRQDYTNWCERFVENAYGTTGQYTSAWAHREGAAKRGTLYTDPTQAQVGDLVFFRPDPSNGNFGHVGIVSGPGRMVSARNGGVGEDDFTKGYWGGLRAGFAQPPGNWKGPTQTPDLVAGAQKLMASVTSSRPGALVAGWRTDEPTPAPKDTRMDEYLRKLQEAERAAAGRVSDLQAKLGKAPTERKRLQQLARAEKDPTRAAELEQQRAQWDEETIAKALEDARKSHATALTNLTSVWKELNPNPTAGKTSQELDEITARAEASRATAVKALERVGAINDPASPEYAAAMADLRKANAAAAEIEATIGPKVAQLTASAAASQAAARASNVQADLAPGRAAAENAQSYASAEAQRASARRSDVETGLLPQESAARVGLQGAQQRAADAETAIRQHQLETQKAYDEAAQAVAAEIAAGADPMAALQKARLPLEQRIALLNSELSRVVQAEAARHNVATETQASQALAEAQRSAQAQEEASRVRQAEEERRNRATEEASAVGLAETMRANRAGEASREQTSAIALQSADEAARHNVESEILGRTGSRPQQVAASTAALQGYKVASAPFMSNVLSAQAPLIGEEGLGRIAQQMGVGQGVLDGVLAGYRAHVAQNEQARASIPPVRRAPDRAQLPPETADPFTVAGLSVQNPFLRALLNARAPGA